MKCPRCNSSRINKEIVDDELIILCLKCGFINKRELDKIDVPIK